jgi:hypothetical protein
MPALEIRPFSMNRLAGQMTLLIFNLSYILHLWIGDKVAGNRPVIIDGEGSYSSNYQG